MNIDDAIDRAGYGPFHYILLMLSGVGFAASTIELVLPSLLLPKLVSEWSLSSTAAGTLMMGTFAGEVLGGLVWARVSDKLGRRVAYVGTATLAAICAAGSACCQNFTQLVVSRVVLGLALGGSMAIDFVYFMEFMPLYRRGSRATMIILVGIAGLFLVGLLGHVVLPGFGWRVFLFTCAIPNLALAVGRLVWPWESPRFLLKSGRPQEAEKVLEVMSTWNGCAFKPTLQYDNSVFVKSTKSGNILTDCKDLLPLILTFGSVFTAHTFSYYGMTTWFGKFAANYKVSSVGHAKGLMLIAVTEVPGLFLSCWLIDRFGRRTVLALNLFGAAITVSLFAVIPVDQTWFMVTSCASYFFIVGVWAGLYVYGPEVFPTECRSTAFALCGTMGKFGGLISPMVFGQVWDRFEEPIPVARNLIAGGFLIGAVLSVWSLKETKGKSMQ